MRGSISGRRPSCSSLLVSSSRKASSDSGFRSVEEPARSRTHRPKSPPPAGMPEPLLHRPSLADTTVLNNFAQTRRTDLLRSAFPDFSTPIPAWDELELGVSRGLVPACDWSWLKIIALTERENARAEEIGRALGP